MTNSEIQVTGGSGFTSDALPFSDLQRSSKDAFEVEDGTVYLKGSISRSSGSKAFPPREVCLETGARDMEAMRFGPFGRLYSYSTIHVSSTRPVPYTIGYVDFENGVRVLAVVEAQQQELECDIQVKLASDGDRWFVTPITANEQTPGGHA